MNTNIFVNLPVSNLDKSKEFFTKLGFTINDQFTDETAAAIVISDTIFMMLLTQEKFKQFTKKEVANATKTTEAIIALSAESKEKVDEFVDKALEAGATITREPDIYDFMYSRSFDDLDGHQWEILWMDPNFVQK